jgi:hypothetical protein
MNDDEFTSAFNAPQAEDGFSKAFRTAISKQMPKPEVWEQYGYPKNPAATPSVKREVPIGSGKSLDVAPFMLDFDLRDKPSNFQLGVDAALKRQFKGLKGMFTDLTPAEREELAASKAYIEAAPWQATAGEIFGQAVPQIALSKITPAIAGVKGLLSRVTGAGAYGAATEPENRGEAAMYGMAGQVGGEALGYTIPHVVKLGKKVYEGLAGMFHAPTAAAQILGNFADVPGRTIPETVERTRTYERLPGLKPTLAMVVPESQRTLLEFENYVRTKFGKTALAEADIYNQQAILKGLQERAFDPTQATKEMELLNAETGALRKTAFEKAREKSSAELAAPIMRVTSDIRTRPGETGLGSPAAQTLASEIENIALGPVRNKSVIGAGGLAVDVPVFARKVDPANLYAARKTIDDVLRGAVGPNDEIKNAIKANKVTSIELKGAIDEALKEASAGNWEKYLNTYIEKIKPIEEGKAFQGVLDLFNTAPRIPGSTLASISPYKMRKAASEATYKEIGTSLKDILSPEGRSFLDDAANAMSAIENVRSGLNATNNSATASRFYEMVRNAPKAVQPVLSAGLAAVNILTKNKSQEIIVDALKNPENFQAIVNRYNKMNKVPISPSQAKGLQVLLGSVGAGAAQQR